MMGHIYTDYLDATKDVTVAREWCDEHHGGGGRSSRFRCRRPRGHLGEHSSPAHEEWIRENAPSDEDMAYVLRSFGITPEKGNET